MHALVLEHGQLLLQDLPEPSLPSGFEMVSVRACGICGSDLRYWAGDNPWALQTLGEAKPGPARMVLGHELAGVVTRDGKERPVAVLAYRACGRCYSCRRGRENLCAHVEHLGHSAGWEGNELNPGGFAERCPVWSEMLYPLPPGVSLVDATLLDALAVAVHAVRRAELVPGAAVVVMGAGPLGLLILQVAALLGAGCTVAVDPSATSRRVAVEFGALAGLDPSGLSPQELFGQLREALGPEGAEVVFDTSGDLPAQEAGLRALVPGGRLVLLAGTAGLQLAQAALAGERLITTSANNTYPDFQAALDLMAAGRLQTAPLITHVLPLEEAVRAFEIAAHKAAHGALKVVVTVDGK
jgi:threonine dehydrogenase-like Zn-dependent dehydrogenase